MSHHHPLKSVDPPLPAPPFDASPTLGHCNSLQGSLSEARSLSSMQEINLETAEEVSEDISQSGKDGKTVRSSESLVSMGFFDDIYIPNHRFPTPYYKKDDSKKNVVL